jgi:hypothetical protein
MRHEGRCRGSSSCALRTQCFLDTNCEGGFRIGIMRAALRALRTIVDGAEGYAG